MRHYWLKKTRCGRVTLNEILNNYGLINVKSKHSFFCENDKIKIPTLVQLTFTCSKTTIDTKLFFHKKKNALM